MSVGTAHPRAGKGRTQAIGRLAAQRWGLELGGWEDAYFQGVSVPHNSTSFD
ncbi:hypothetical protein GGTG_02906 [Gaeumannomyces tritici R3-111a-1]|uniref:Uncharacterized protein n=1 Tax=Gaeumannomyces tritici (strain R3-111a-1) TaxID=644352 RepID=J3NNP9_GAET3|nr:hypothetical protein GGTG_02906 [Gaeumannomyces tritici R3-111a-1]EJT77801.1 hypothetical protein GGTG_02906 [Gaeumannomyces tritici R3-111a-1]